MTEDDPQGIYTFHCPLCQCWCGEDSVSECAQCGRLVCDMCIRNIDDVQGDACHACWPLPVSPLANKVGKTLFGHGGPLARASANGPSSTQSEGSIVGDQDA